MLFTVAFGFPKVIQEHLRGFHARILSGLYLRFGPVNTVNLRLTVGKRTEVVVFCRIL